MFASPLIEKLVESLRCLPGVGPKSAQRMALYLLERNREGGKHLADVLDEALEKVGHCAQCRTLTEDEFCGICSNPSRNRNLLCVVGSPADVYAIEQTGSYRGLYFVLMGHLSPIDYIAEQLKGFDIVISRIAHGVPVGGELEFVDGGTLSHAFNGRLVVRQL